MMTGNQQAIKGLHSSGQSRIWSEEHSFLGHQDVGSIYNEKPFVTLEAAPMDPMRDLTYPRVLIPQLHLCCSHF